MQNSNVVPIWPSLPTIMNSQVKLPGDKVYVYTVVFEDTLGTDSVTHSIFGSNPDETRARVENMFKAGMIKGVPSAPDVQLVSIKVQLAGKESYSLKFYKEVSKERALTVLNDANSGSRSASPPILTAIKAPGTPGTDEKKFDIEDIGGVYKVMTAPRDIVARTYTKDMHKKGEKMFPTLTKDAAV